VEEVRALKKFFKPSRRTVLTSFKSQIGHTLGASGISNLIRGTMAMKTGVFPATLNYEHPDPEMGLDGSGLLIATEPFDWKSSAGEPRRLQVNSFGFGGSNYVVQMEQALDEVDTIMVCPDRASGLLREKGAGHPGIQGISFFRSKTDERSFRTAVIAQSDEEALTIIGRSTAPAEAGIVSPKALRALAQQGIYVSPEDLPVPPLAFVFPGQGTHYAGMGRNLYESFPVIREWMDRAAVAADFDLLHLLFHDREENLQKTRWQQPALFAMEHAMARYLLTLGINPVAMAGHSLGELTALCLAGVYSVEDGFRIVNMRARCMDKVAAGNTDPGVMAAVDAPLALLKEMIEGQEDPYIGNINSPNQIVLSGGTEAVRNISKRLKEMGYRATLLPVSMAFHSPIMKAIHDELDTFVASIPFHPPQIPVLSNTTMEPYPSDPGEIRRILMAHLASTVNWMDNVQTLWNDHGVRLFVEVGPGDIISNLIADTLSEPACIQTCLPSGESLTFRTALARLFVQGHLKVQGEPRWVNFSAFAKSAACGRNTAIEEAIPETTEHQDHMEALIHIIMDATGFNRDEIRPDMDLRRDLSIRSSRLPIIMDAAERHFGITIEMEDFIHVRTVRDIAQKISEIVTRQGGAGLQPAARSVAPATAIMEKSSLASGPAHEGRDLMERLIRIIMDATGFERDEINPEMDLRKDLSIRSSRLPIIMDAAERQFGITIEMEDFIGARTVKDIAQRISNIIARQEGTGLQPDTKSLVPGQERAEILKSTEGEASLKRLAFNHAAVELAASVPIALSAGESVLLLSPEKEDAIAERAGEILRQDYGVDTIPMRFMPRGSGPGRKGYDILTDEGSGKAAEKISGMASLAGMVITLPQSGSGRLGCMADVSRFLKGLFPLLKAFLQSPKKKFVVLIHSREEADTLGRLLEEGMLGFFLSAAQEYSSVQFRTLEIGKDTELRTALNAALDRGYAAVEMIQRDENVFTSEARLAPSVLKDSSSLNLNPGDVVVMSGGATGISAHLARSLVPFMPRLVFLGRTSLDAGIGKASEIARTLADLHSLGIEATYHTCDVTDPESVRAVMGEVVNRYGRIDGIIHGAGVLRDALLSQMTPADFSVVTDIKFLGAWNLCSAAERAGLRFFVGLSSVAAIQGNIGQANYAAANRMMSALLRYLGRRNDAVRFKALMLPPVEGAGMADDPELRALLKRKGVEYIHVNELAGLFCRELFVSPADDVWVMFMRKLPSVRTSLINDINNSNDAAPYGELDGGAIRFNSVDFPMIERISCLDIRREELEAFRTFSMEKDLWIADHRPFKFIKHPLVSAVMILETFMEAGRILYPHLQVRGVRKLRLMDMIQCPPGIPRPCRISCRRSGNDLREVLCEVSLAAQEISPAGRLTDRFTPHCMGQVILDAGENVLGEALTDFPVRPDELRTKHMDHKKVLKWYKDRSGLEGRYRVMESLDGAGPGVVRGLTVCRETTDFANLPNARYQYSPYLFEVLLQLTGFYIAATDASERRSMIPMEIGEMRFLRKCRDGEQITLEARMRMQDEKGLSWDARGVDDQGQAIIQVRDMRMQWGLD
jgi:malonyl CoA-acyl carrier protein transacylase